jgi:hypothetical protein
MNADELAIKVPAFAANTETRVGGIQGREAGSEYMVEHDMRGGTRRSEDRRSRMEEGMNQLRHGLAVAFLF